VGKSGDFEARGGFFMGNLLTSVALNLLFMRSSSSSCKIYNEDFTTLEFYLSKNTLHFFTLSLIIR